MYNFFVNELDTINSKIVISGADYNHAVNVLRLKIGDKVSVSINGKNNLCSICEITDDKLFLEIVEKDFIDTSLPIKIALFQGLPKFDKMELIIQKAVELGAEEIIPVQMKRCVVKIEDKKMASKTQRFNAISESAAKQCKRAIIPKVFDALPLKLAIEKAKDFDHVIVPYESHNGMENTKNALSMIKGGDKIAVFIGPEGGFDDSEIALLKDAGAKTISLGKRILRTETAAITAISMLMLHAEMNI